jgi:hypothetical protein
MHCRHCSIGADLLICLYAYLHMLLMLVNCLYANAIICLSASAVICLCSYAAMYREAYAQVGLLQLHPFPYSPIPIPLGRFYSLVLEDIPLLERIPMFPYSPVPLFPFRTRHRPP